MFVSTVRSRHRVSQLTDGGVGEFGFLSESQLVNTALTRAKSWLAVIGDPVALCSIGNCGALWRTYLKHCQKAGGIHPADLSLEDIWQHSQSLTNLLTVNTVNASSGVVSTKLGQVSRDAMSQSQDIMRASPQFSLETTSSASKSTSSGSSSAAATSGPCKTVSVGDSQERPAHLSVYTSQSSSVQSRRPSTHCTATQPRTPAQVRGRRALSEDGSSEECDSDGRESRDMTSARRVAAAALMSLAEWSLDYQLEPDEIIQQLVKVCILESCIFVKVSK